MKHLLPALLILAACGPVHNHYIAPGPAESEGYEAPAPEPVVLDDLSADTETPEPVETPAPAPAEPTMNCKGATRTEGSEEPYARDMVIVCLNLIYGLNLNCHPDEDDDLECVDPANEVMALLSCTENQQTCAFASTNHPEDAYDALQYNSRVSGASGYVSYDIQFADGTKGECKMALDKSRVVGCFTPDE